MIRLHQRNLTPLLFVGVLLHDLAPICLGFLKVAFGVLLPTLQDILVILKYEMPVDDLERINTSRRRSTTGNSKSTKAAKGGRILPRLLFKLCLVFGRSEIVSRVIIPRGYLLCAVD